MLIASVGSLLDAAGQLFADLLDVQVEQLCLGYAHAPDLAVVPATLQNSVGILM